MSMTIFQEGEYYGDNNDNDNDDDADDNDEDDNGSDNDCAIQKTSIYLKNVNYLDGCSPVMIFLHQFIHVSI